MDLITNEQKNKRIKDIGNAITKKREDIERSEEHLHWIKERLEDPDGEFEPYNKGYKFRLEIQLRLTSSGSSDTTLRRLSGEKKKIVLGMFKIDAEEYLKRLNEEHNELVAELQTLSTPSA